ncbi:MAG TPA: phosphatidate cytidylyltransferase [Bryobacteraceae bacterium]|nr:phosphatidate cytidylyltransferase [Bryobacteraceae bacterium]
MKRVLTAAALIPPVIATIFLAPYWVFFAVVALVAVLCYAEYDSIAASYNFGAPGPLGYVAGLALLWVPGGAWLIIVAAALIAFTLSLRSADLAHALPRSALLVTGVVYVFGTWRCALPLHQLNPHWLMYALIVNWTGDIGAYYVGRSFGKRRLASRVSPKKSWEGAGAAVATSVLIAGAYLVYFVPDVGFLEAIGLTVVANIAGQLGDLCESAMKRGAGIKDSGRLLPGHGGFLDRVDSTLFSLPVIYAFTLLRTQSL